MKLTEKPAYFDVSLTTLQNWKRQGCPIDADIGAIAEWIVRRDMERAGIVGSRLPELVREHFRRIDDLNRRTKDVNSWPPDVKTEPGLIKAAMVWGLTLERALLELPDRILSSSPKEVPDCFYKAVFASLDELRAGKGGDTVQEKSSIWRCQDEGGT